MDKSVLDWYKKKKEEELKRAQLKEQEVKEEEAEEKESEKILDKTEMLLTEREALNKLIEEIRNIEISKVNEKFKLSDLEMKKTLLDIQLKEGQVKLIKKLLEEEEEEKEENEII